MQMIYLGTDIVEIKRIRKNIDLKSTIFLNKIFTKKEIKYCQLKADPAIHFSGRFAAKEAIKKAILSSGILKYISMKEIEIISANSIPKVNVESIDNCIKISISHTNDFATAMAICQIK